MKRYEPSWTDEQRAQYEHGYAIGISGRLDPRANLFAAQFLSIPLDHPEWHGCVDGVAAWLGTYRWSNAGLDWIKAHPGVDWIGRVPIDDKGNLTGSFCNSSA